MCTRASICRLVTLTITILAVAACAPVSEAPKPLSVKESTEALAEKSATVDLVRTYKAPDDGQALDIAVIRFAIEKEGRGADTTGGVESISEERKVGSWVFTEILDIESQYLPTVLRKTLMNSNQWGVIRVLPKHDLSMDLSVQGTIVQSDGVLLELHVSAEDTTGRQWLNKKYSKTNLADLLDSSQKRSGLTGVYIASSDNEDPFQSLYNQIANDLLAMQRSLSKEQIRAIKRVSEIKHASDLSPETFSSLLSKGEDGLLQVTRLLADNDPMLERVRRMQLRHHIFIDTLDDYYLELNRDMQPVYDLWRYYSREQILEIETELRKDKNKSRNSSGFNAIANNYYRYKANKLFEQEWTELATGFTSELEPTILELEDQVYGLSGSVEDQYVQWREILRQFYLLDRGE